MVEDSLKWQKESKSDKNLFSSPKESPIRKRPQNISDGIKSLNLKPSNTEKLEALDPTAIEDIEKHARYLAACIDSMVENLSGVLQSDSALTVETLEAYRYVNTTVDTISQIQNDLLNCSMKILFKKLKFSTANKPLIFLNLSTRFWRYSHMEFCLAIFVKLCFDRNSYSHW